MTDNYGLVTIIDKWFDNYNKRDTILLLENNVTLFNFLKSVYSYLQEASWKEIKAPDDTKTKLEIAKDSLYYTYLYCLEELIERIRILESKKVYYYSFKDLNYGSTNSEIFKSMLLAMADLKKKYISREFYPNLNKENQKIDYDKLYSQTIYFGYELSPEVTYKNGNTTIELPYYKKYGEESDNIYSKDIIVIAEDGIEKENAISSDFFSNLQNKEDIILDITIDGQGSCYLAYGYDGENQTIIFDSKEKAKKTIHIALSDKNKKYFPSSTVIVEDIEGKLVTNGLYFYFIKGKYKISVKYRTIYSRNDGYIKVDSEGYTVYIKGNKEGFYKDDEVENIISDLTDDADDVRYLFRKRKGVNDNYYETQFLFANGAPVDYLNSYESNLIIFAEIFDAIKKTLEEKGNTNYIDLFLKKYFYDGLLERYRTNKIEDYETAVNITDTDFNKNKFNVFDVYETLKGKGKEINNFGSLDFSYKLENRKQKYIAYKLDKSYFKNGKLYLYINVNKLDNYLKFISNYSVINYDTEKKSFLKSISEKYDNFKSGITKHVQYFSNLDNGEIGRVVEDDEIYKEASEYLKDYSNELKKNIIENYFFAIRCDFVPEETINKNFYNDNIRSLTKEYYYDEYKNLIFDVYFSNDNKKKFLVVEIETDINSSEEYNLGEGILYTGRVKQQLKDNIISRIKSSQEVKRDISFEPIEFFSAMDDREFTVSITSDVITNAQGQNLYWDKNTEQFVTITIPNYRYATLYKENDNYYLDVNDFSKYNNIDLLTQIRIVDYSNNSKKYLFNIKDVKTKFIKKSYFDLEAINAIDFNDLKSNGLSYYNDNIVYLSNANISNESVDVLYNKNETCSINNNNEILIKYNKQIFTEDTDYIYNEELHLEKNSKIEFKLINMNKSYYGMIMDEEHTNLSENENYNIEKYLVLEPNINIDDLIGNNSSKKVKIIDFIQSGNNSKFFNLKEQIYDDKNNTIDYFYHDTLQECINIEKINKKVIKNFDGLYIHKNNYFYVYNENITSKGITKNFDGFKFNEKVNLPSKTIKLIADKKFSTAEVNFIKKIYFTIPEKRITEKVVAKTSSWNGIKHEYSVCSPNINLAVSLFNVKIVSPKINTYNGKNGFVFVGKKVDTSFFNLYNTSEETSFYYKAVINKIKTGMTKIVKIPENSCKLNISKLLSSKITAKKANFYNIKNNKMTIMAQVNKPIIKIPNVVALSGFKLNKFVRTKNISIKLKEEAKIFINNVTINTNYDYIDYNFRERLLKDIISKNNLIIDLEAWGELNKEFTPCFAIRSSIESINAESNIDKFKLDIMLNMPSSSEKILIKDDFEKLNFERIKLNSNVFDGKNEEVQALEVLQEGIVFDIKS